MGEVKLSTSEYSMLLLENQRLKSAIEFRKGYWNEKSMEVTINLSKLAPEIRQAFAKEPFADNFVLNDIEQLGNTNGIELAVEDPTLWEDFLNQYFCKADELTGNRPCDSGEACDRCHSEEVDKNFKTWKQRKIMRK